MRMSPLTFRTAIVGAVLLGGWGWNAAAAPVTTQFTVTGDVTAPATYNFSRLSALPPTTENVTYQSGGTTVNTSFTGPTLWSLLNTVGLVTPPPPVKNGVLLQYVVATGSDGYSALFSLGELNPNFGGSTPQVLVANLQGTPPAPLGSTEFARAVAAKDNFGGRYVSNLNNLRVGTAQVQTSMGGGETSKFSLSGAVRTPGTYNLASLEALPATRETVTFLSSGTSVTETFIGVSIWTLLTDAGIVTNPAIKNDILNYYLQATGSDGYSAIFSLGELDPMFGGSATAPDLIAYEMEVDGVDEPLGANGFARVVVPGDSRGGRYVSNLVNLAVVDAVPEPASIMLLAAVLLALTLVKSVRLAAKPRNGSAMQPGCARLSHRLYCPHGEAHLASRFRTRTGRWPWQDTAARGDS
jgi:DMSO/TMAO reductase YedYZ molybdopterin-dependent catalytic subunit